MGFGVDFVGAVLEPASVAVTCTQRPSDACWHTVSEVCDDSSCDGLVACVRDADGTEDIAAEALEVDDGAGVNAKPAARKCPRIDGDPGAKARLLAERDPATAGRCRSRRPPASSVLLVDDAVAAPPAVGSVVPVPVLTCCKHATRGRATRAESGGDR